MLRKYLKGGTLIPEQRCLSLDHISIDTCLNDSLSMVMRFPKDIFGRCRKDASCKTFVSLSSIRKPGPVQSASSPFSNNDITPKRHDLNQFLFLGEEHQHTSPGWVSGASTMGTVEVRTVTVIQWPLYATTSSTTCFLISNSACSCEH